MSFKVKFADTDKEDLRNIATYIAEQSKDRTIAINFVNELREKTKILEQFPESGAIPDDRTMKSFGYRFLVHKEYLIFYHFEQKENISYILAVFNTKKDVYSLYEALCEIVKNKK